MGPDGTAEDVQAACEAYDRALAEAGGVDLQLLGIGTDGHIGFNEPCSSLASRTRIKTLTEQTRVDNARFFDGDIEQVPHHVITQGIGTILEARHLVLLATGEGKADAVAATVEGPVAAVCPASALQLHPHATVVVDEAAASKLKLADYFRAHVRQQAGVAGDLRDLPVACPGCACGVTGGRRRPRRSLVRPERTRDAGLPVPAEGRAPGAGPLQGTGAMSAAVRAGRPPGDGSPAAAWPQTRAAPWVAMWRAPRGGAWGTPISTTTVSGRAARRVSRAAAIQGWRCSSRTTATMRRCARRGQGRGARRLAGEAAGPGAGQQPGQFRRHAPRGLVADGDVRHRGERRDVRRRR